MDVLGRRELRAMRLLHPPRERRQLQKTSGLFQVFPVRQQRLVNIEHNSRPPRNNLHAFRRPPRRLRRPRERALVTAGVMPRNTLLPENPKIRMRLAQDRATSGQQQGKESSLSHRGLSWSPWKLCDSTAFLRAASPEVRKDQRYQRRIASSSLIRRASASFSRSSRTDS